MTLLELCAISVIMPVRLTWKWESFKGSKRWGGCRNIPYGNSGCWNDEIWSADCGRPGYLSYRYGIQVTVVRVTWTWGNIFSCSGSVSCIYGSSLGNFHFGGCRLVFWGNQPLSSINTAYFLLVVYLYLHYLLGSKSQKSKVRVNLCSRFTGESVDFSRVFHFSNHMQQETEEVIWAGSYLHMHVL